MAICRFGNPVHDYHAVPVIADLYMKGVGGFDTEAALDAMVKSAEYKISYGGLHSTT